MVLARLDPFACGRHDRDSTLLAFGEDDQHKPGVFLEHRLPIAADLYKGFDSDMPCLTGRHLSVSRILGLLCIPHFAAPNAWPLLWIWKELQWHFHMQDNPDEIWF